MQGMADTIAPTQFNGGWERILRYVNDWGQKTLVSDQIWLMMEDIWVQRSMLEAIKSVNEQIGEFSRVKYVKNGQPIDDPDPNNPTGPQGSLAAKFHSRVWDVTLEVGTRGNKQYLTGSLENNTERLQVLGIGRKTTLKVWLERNSEGGTEGIEPVEFVIDSEFLPGKGGMKKIKDRNGKEIEVPANMVTIQPDESNDKEFDKYKNIIPPGKTVSEIVKVEQVFDAQTVPVRRIEAMALNFTDSRYAAMGNLLPPPSPPFAKLDPAAASGSSGSTTPSAPPAGEGGEPPSLVPPAHPRPYSGWWRSIRHGRHHFDCDSLGRWSHRERHRRQQAALRRDHPASPSHAGWHHRDRRSSLYARRASGIRQLVRCGSRLLRSRGSDSAATWAQEAPAMARGDRAGR